MANVELKLKLVYTSGMLFVERFIIYLSILPLDTIQDCCVNYKTGMTIQLNPILLVLHFLQFFFSLKSAQVQKKLDGHNKCLLKFNLINVLSIAYRPYINKPKPNHSLTDHDILGTT